jgi:hypothetical protein
MSDDLPGPPGSGPRDDRPTDRPTEPLAPGSPTTPVPEPPAVGSPPPQAWPEVPPPQPPQEPGQPGYGPPGYGPPGYGPPGYGQPGYGPPPGYGYGYPGGPPTDSSATAALVIAIVGFFVCPPVGAIVALVMANSATKRIEASGGRLGGLELARAARIIAIIELVLTVLLIIGAVVAITASVNARY